jgi:hypothetical protein
MPRRPNTKPTNIYWLYDTRPETVAVFGPEGQPFYCGKTVCSIGHRFRGHRNSVAKHPERKISKYLILCGELVRTVNIEIVLPNADWVERERHWIRTLRTINPNCANESDGGDGVPGMIHTAKSRQRMSTAKCNPTQETRRKLSEYASNRPAEVNAKLGAASRGRVDTDVTRKRRSESHLGLVKSPETCERIRLAKLNQTAETRRKISAAKTGYKYSEAALAGIREGQRKRRLREAVATQFPPPPY